MSRWILIAVASLVVSLSAERASAALVCEASIQDVVFGQVSIRDGAADTTLANVTITCSGGTPSSTARVCIDIGAGSAGASAGNSPRYLLGLQAGSIAYQLTEGNYHSSGGSVWNSAEFDVGLDGGGNGTIVPALYAEITSSGDQFAGGVYTSTFSGAADVDLTYGAGGSCTTGGDVNGFQVSADITPSCSINAWPLDFGNIDGAISGPIDNSTTIDISCTSGTAYSVTLGLGMGSGVNNPAQRKMMNGADGLTYGLYLDAGRTAPWGESAGTDHDGTGTGTTQTVPVYGRIQAPQNVPVGTYTDSVVVTIEY